MTIFDVPGAYLNYDIPKFIVLRIKGESVDIMCSINAKHNNNGLIPDVTAHKGSSKHHKTDEKSPILWCRFLHQFRLNFFSPLHPAHIQKCIGLIKNPNSDGETCTTV